MNDGPLCRCSIKSRRTGIRHDKYPGEQVGVLFCYGLLIRELLLFFAVWLMFVKALLHGTHFLLIFIQFCLSEVSLSTKVMQCKQENQMLFVIL
jgi:hypothetical protein